MEIPLVHGNTYLEKRQPQKWLIKGWIPEKGLAMLYGDPGSGKTFVSIDMMLSISTGKEFWHGCRISYDRRTVVYLCGEGNEGNGQRIFAWMREKCGQMDTGSFYIVPIPFNLDDPKVLKMVIDTLEKNLTENPCFIVIDTLNMYFTGEENNARDARRFITSCKRLIDRFDASVMVIHHSGKSKDAKDEARGSSAFLGAMDAAILAVNKNGEVYLESKKQKNVKIPEPMKFAFKSCLLIGWESDDDGEPPTSLILESRDMGIYETITFEMDALRKAWLDSGGKVDEDTGCPYVSKEDVKAYFRKLGKSKDFIYNLFRPGSGRFASKLLSSSLIEEREKDVFHVVSKDYIETFLKLKNDE